MHGKDRRYSIKPRSIVIFNEIIYILVRITINKELIRILKIPSVPYDKHVSCASGKTRMIPIDNLLFCQQRMIGRSLIFMSGGISNQILRARRAAQS